MPVAAARVNVPSAPVRNGPAYYILEKCLISCNPNDHILANAVGKEYKGAISVVLYLVAIPLAYVHVSASYVLYIVCALVWFLPDRRIEAQMRS